MVNYFITALLLLISTPHLPANPTPPHNILNPLYFYRIEKIFLLGKSVQLENKSIWKVLESDLWKMGKWSEGDSIVITASHDWWHSSWYSNYGYCMNNETKGSYVHVDLEKAPPPFGKETDWISALEKHSGYLFLVKKGPCWKIDPNDKEIFEGWRVNDSIILGSNDHWFSSYGYILINLRTKGHVHATFD